MNEEIFKARLKKMYQLDGMLSETWSIDDEEEYELIQLIVEKIRDLEEYYQEKTV